MRQPFFRLFISFVLVGVLGVGLMGILPSAASAETAGNEPNASLLDVTQTVTDTEKAPRTVGAATSAAFAPTAVGDQLFQIDTQATTGSILLLGVEFAQGSYWVTSAGMTTTSEANIFYQLDTDGTVLNSWNQGTSSLWGWRDLAYDGTYLYASDSNFLAQIDPTTGLTTGVTVPCPENPCRALAYDSNTDHFWTANFSSDIYEFDRSGTIVNQYANTLSVYGAAWDVHSAGGPYLWLWSQDGSGGHLATQIDPTTGNATGISFEGIATAPGSAGGATIVDNHPDYTGHFFVGLHQAGSDIVVGYDLDATPTAVTFSSVTGTQTDHSLLWVASSLLLLSALALVSWRKRARG